MVTSYDDINVTYDQSSLTYQGLPAQFDGVSFAVEMAFGYEPLDVDPSWESVTPYVRGFSIDRGRNSEFSTYGPGTVSISLDNRDRRFDPEHTTGPYFGDLNPMVPVRVQATYSGVTYTMFYGFVQGWPTVYNQSNTDAVASVTAVDATRLLANVLNPEFELLRQIDADNPSWYVYYRGFTDFTGPQSIPDYKNRGNWNRLGYGEQQLSIVENNVPIGFAQFVFDDAAYRHTPSVGGYDPAARTIEFWFDDRVAYTTNAHVFVRFSQLAFTTQHRFEIAVQWVAASSQWQLAYVRYDSDLDSLYGTASPGTVLSTVGGVNHVAITLDGTTLRTYVNGSLVHSLSLSSSGSATSLNLLEIATDLNDNPVAWAHLAAFSTPLTAARIVAHYDAGQGYRGELSSTRLDRLLDEADWPTAWRDIETGVQAVGAYRPDFSSVTEYFPQIDNAEQGSLFVNREGEVEFRSRTTAETANIVGLFDDSGTDLPFANVSVDAHTVDAIRNNVIVNYAFGSTTSTDSASVAAYGRATETVDAGLIDDASSAQSIGDTLLARAKDPRTRVTRLDINVRRDPANLVPVVAALDLSDDVTVSLTPTGVGDVLWRAVRVQGISHTVTPQSWDVSLYLAPGPINTNGPLMVLDDDTYGVLDSNKLG